MVYHEVIQHQHQPDQTHSEPLQQGICAVYLNGSLGEWFRTTVGVRQDCLLSPTLFNIYLESIMTGALEDHEGSVSIGGRTITNLRFADDIDGVAGSEEELSNLVERLDRPRQPMAWRLVQEFRNISLKLKIRLMHSLVTTVFFYACDGVSHGP